MMNDENNEIRVWDPMLRLFHWSLVVFFVIGYVTGEEESDVHIYAGYTVLGLIIFRVFWGFIGSKHARFRDFLYSPKAVCEYLQELISNNPRFYAGHNPAGGWMIMALLVSLFIVSISGLKVYAIEEGLGPLAAGNADLSVISNAYAEREEDDDNEKQENEHDSDKRINKQEEEFWEEIHEISANFTVFLIVLHVLGVIAASRLHNENLIKAMITGKKKVKREAIERQ